MPLFKLKLIPAVAALTMAGLAGTANAAAYAYSYDNISGLTISNPVGVVAMGATNTLSRATATLNGANVSTGGVGFLDAPQATLGAVTKEQNTFSPQGWSGTASYSRGDAQLVSTQFPAFPANATNTHEVNAAESFLTPAGNAAASAHNDSTSGLSVDFAVISPNAKLRFDFLAAPYMDVFLGALAGDGSSAAANLLVTFSITNAAGMTVFNWAPDGNKGTGISGGHESDDGASLNLNLGASGPTAGAPSHYDPAGCGAPTGAATAAGCTGLHFSATTDTLSRGDYTLTLNALESTDVAINSTDVAISQVPEPGTLALLGAGMAGLCLRRRREAAK